jgi:hypothetical protein
VSRLARLIELAEAEHVCAAEVRADELAPVQEALAAELATLPQDLDEGEHAVLVAVHALREQTIELLRIARDDAAAQVAKLGHGRTAMRGYAPAGAEPGRSVDTAV